LSLASQSQILQQRAWEQLLGCWSVLVADERTLKLQALHQTRVPWQPSCEASQFVQVLLVAKAHTGDSCRLLHRGPAGCAGLQEGTHCADVPRQPKLPIKIRPVCQENLQHSSKL
jgi:hypothetical protein